MKHWTFALILVFALVGCGYQPASHYAQSVVGESVSTEVIVSMEDPQNTVLIKDAVDMAVITKFRTSLVSKNASQTHLKISISSVSFIPLQYNINGYVTTYRTTVFMNIERIKGDQHQMYTTTGMYDFAIEPNSIISEQARFEAISQGSQKAIDAFIAQISAQGANSK
ncbi:MAG: LPS assembly lipoprotein LptE [Sulfuricurvum sp.]|nr:LPS assembly lipoprotein LptE [Sulfuricurvum sp.]